MTSSLRNLPVLTLSLVMIGCGMIETSRPTPLPGWQSPVSNLFIPESAFPEGWRIAFPEDTSTDPAVSSVMREWEGPPAGSATQSIWRAYTVAAAAAEYRKLRVSQFQPSRPLYPGTIFVPFSPPPEITFQSQTADEFYLACGWWGHSYCEIVSRYRNYVVDLRLERPTEQPGGVIRGLTYAEIETVVKAMDARFAQAMAEFYPPTR